MKRLLLLSLFFIGSHWASGQHWNLGLTFQYFTLKQIQIHSPDIIAANSFNYYTVTDNRWKFFGAGQSFVIGTVAMVDVQKFYFAIEPSGELNTYDYALQYALSPTAAETVSFKTLFLQFDMPMYMGYYFKSSDLVRYSLFAGAGPVIPFHLETSIRNPNDDPNIYNRYGSFDLNNILYNTKPYWNATAGFGIHFASLGRFEFRYSSRLGSPGTQYRTTFNSVGIGMTFFLPLHVLKKKIYYEE